MWDASLLVTVGSRQCLDIIVGKTENGLCTSQLKSGQIGGFDKGPDQIIPKPPAPGENLEIKFPSPWEQIGKGLKKPSQTKQDKKEAFTLN